MVDAVLLPACAFVWHETCHACTRVYVWLFGVCLIFFGLCIVCRVFDVHCGVGFFLFLKFKPHFEATV